MNSQQHFFQAFFGPQQPQIEQRVPEYIVYNEAILEIANNWTCVQDLMCKFREGKLKAVDNLEQSWFNFISRNNIDITKYQTEVEFIQAFWKIPA